MGPEGPCVDPPGQSMPRLTRLVPPTPLVVGRGGEPAGGEPAGPRSQGRRSDGQGPEACAGHCSAATGRDVPVLPMAVARL